MKPLFADAIDAVILLQSEDIFANRKRAIVLLPDARVSPLAQAAIDYLTANHGFSKLEIAPAGDGDND